MANLLEVTIRKNYLKCMGHKMPEGATHIAIGNGQREPVYEQYGYYVSSIDDMLFIRSQWGFIALEEAFGPLPAARNKRHYIFPEVYVKKPPVGITTRHLHNAERIADIIKAMVRYENAGKHIPDEWCEELTELAKQANKTR